MNGVEPTAGAATKILEVLKDLPLWLLGGLAASAGVLLHISPFAVSLPPATRPSVIIAEVIFGVLAVARAIALLLQRMPVWAAARDLRRRFHLTPEPQQSFWSSAKQADDSIVTQVVLRFAVKNRTAEPLALTRARLVKPRIRGEIVGSHVYIRAVNQNIYGDGADSGHLIPPKTFLPGTASVLIRGVPWWRVAKQVRVKMGISDDEGHEEFITLHVRVLSAPAKEPTKSPLEMVSSISNPVEREVATVLQAELARYQKCGRTVGGLGSVHLSIDGREITGVGTDSWDPRSPKNQSISANPEACELRSDNLDALITFYAGLQANEKEQFASALLARIDGKAYLPVTYFIVCVLWRIGRLRDALEKAKASLPQGEIKVFGLSNALMLLNGLLRYRHPDFTNEMLDDIERFLVGLNEHPFQIPEKLAAIRTARLLAVRPAIQA
ncbi:MAG TPA: hypothetical protein VJN89_00710 [Candidatus Acidoferrum sp.]|nr:hypothetical protein [Candidatus Acidoferrum sp.]